MRECVENILVARHLQELFEWYIIMLKEIWRFLAGLSLEVPSIKTQLPGLSCKNHLLNTLLSKAQKRLSPNIRDSVTEIQLWPR